MEIRQELLEKAKREYDGYIAYVKGTNVEKAIDNALEIVVKGELLNILEYEKELTETTLEIINRFHIPLDFIYSEWLSLDRSMSREDLTYAINEIARNNTAYKAPEDNIDLEDYEREKEEYFGNNDEDDDMEM